MQKINNRIKNFISATRRIKLTFISKVSLESCEFSLLLFLSAKKLSEPLFPRKIFYISFYFRYVWSWSWF